jgi:hypothetical protein
MIMKMLTLTLITRMILEKKDPLTLLEILTTFQEMIVTMVLKQNKQMK